MTNAEDEWFYEDLQELLELTAKKKKKGKKEKKKENPFHQGRQECKTRKSRDIINNRQIWPWNTKRSKAKANRVCRENMLATANLFPKPGELLHT